MKLLDIFEDFILDQTSKGNTKRTIKDYRTKLNYFFEFTGDINVDEIDLKLCREYYLSLANRLDNTITIQTYIRSLRAFLNWLFVNEYIEVDICKKFKLPKARKNHIFVLSDEEIYRMYEVYNGPSIQDCRNRVILSLMLDCGLRLDEVVTARLDYLYIDERCLVVTGKGNKQRAVAFGLQTEAFLREYLALRDSQAKLILIKVSGIGQGEPITAATIKDMFRQLKIDAKIPRLHPHLLRHTFATRYIENGGSEFALQLLLGHSTINMVRKYVHLAQTRVQHDFLNFSPLDRVHKDLYGEKRE